MILYHGTSTHHLKRINRVGLQPRGKRKSHFSDFPSATDRVYLTDSYAMYFAHHAALINSKAKPVILEVEIPDDSFISDWLIPDEDGLAQHTFPEEHDLAFLNDCDIYEKTKWWRENAPEHFHLAHASLHHIGSLAFWGTVPWKTRPVYYDGYGEVLWGIRKVVTTSHEMCMRFNPQISLPAHRVLGENYKYALKRFMDSDGQADVYLHMADSPFKMIYEAEKKFRESQKENLIV